MLVFIQGTCHQTTHWWHWSPCTHCVFLLSVICALLACINKSRTCHHCLHLVDTCHNKHQCSNIVTKVYQSCWSKFLNVNVAQNSLSIKSSKLSVEQFICRELSSFLSLVSCYRCCCSCTNYKLEQYRLDFSNEPKNKNV